MSYTKEDIIFVIIPCYRDSELLETLKDLYNKAKRPDNIFCGIFLQKDLKEHEDDNLFSEELPRKNQLRILEVDYREPTSVCFAIGSANTLYKNERFVLKIDSHMRFKKNFDSIFVKKLKNIQKNKNIDKVAITVKPAAYELYPEKTNFSDRAYRLGFVNVPDYEIIRMGKYCGYNYNEDITSCVCCACLFYNVLDVNLKYSKFCDTYDELLYSILLFSNGYRIFLSEEMLVNHLNYNEKYLKYENFLKSRKGYSHNMKSKDITKFLINISKTKDPEVLKNIKEYGLGKERTLRDYERFSGIDFGKKTTRQHSTEGYFEDWQEVAKTEEIKNIFFNKYNS